MDALSIFVHGTYKNKQALFWQLKGERFPVVFYKETIRQMYDGQTKNYLATRPWLNFYIRHRIGRFFSSWFKNFQKNHVILHIGCGAGWLEETVSFPPNEWNYVALDFSTKMARSTKKKFPWAEVVNADADFLPFKPCAFDAIIINRCIKFVSVNRLFSQANSVVKNGGSLAVIFDCRDTLVERFFKRINRFCDITQKSSHMINSLNEHGFCSLICAPATMFPTQFITRVPPIFYRLLEFIDKNMKRGRITVIFGKKISPG